MNVLLTNATSIFAGGEDYVLILARHLILRGHSVWVSARPDHLLLRKCAEASIPTVPIGYGDMGRVYAVSRELRGRMKERAIDVVHSNANYDRTCAAIGAAFTPVKHIAGIHSTHSIQHNLTHWLRNRYGTDHFITDADAGKDVLVSQDRIPAAMITTVPIGIDNDSVETRASARAATRAAFGISPDTLVIGNVARLVSFKGQSDLLEAVAEAARTTPDLLLLIVGDGELETDLRRRAVSLGIAPIVRFLGFRDDLDRLYPAFDLYCHSSLELAAEMFPIAILRALASALPVVCTNVGGIAGMVEDRISGYLTAPGDPHALAVGLLDVIARRERRDTMGAASFELFRKKYHASAMAEKVERIYLHSINNHR